MNINDIPVFIQKKKHGNRYDVDLNTKKEICRSYYYGNKISTIISQYKLPRNTINRILKEFKNHDI